MENPNAYLGSGWAFPPEFPQRGYEVRMASDIEDILQSLDILFGTRLNERILQEDYGSSLMDFQFEETRPAMINRLKKMLMDAILIHESRIKVGRLEIEQDYADRAKLLINLDFHVPANNTRFNLVYPFYLEEAS